ncbi:NAD(P)/FAD-dependent oxidoreductase [Salinarimonas sp. NSM]|uniref:NAD(P)/FAD-dependent oxidoreductase n=1 Tax=Salinarimonas sp. NSM TaxID=3458003 RepID=UPI0040368395
MSNGARDIAETGRPFDLAIVGAGIIGIVAALRAAGAGRRILLLDRGAFASGASLRSAGLDFAWGASPTTRALTAESRAWYAALRLRRPDLPIADLPIVHLGRAESFAAMGERFVDGAPRPEPAVLDRLRTLWPDLAPAPGMIAADGGTAQRADVAGVARALLPDLFADPACRLWEGVGLARLEPGPAGVSLVTEDGRRIEAARAVLATGPWAPHQPGLAPGLAGLGLRSKLVVAFHLDVAPPPGAPVVYLMDHDAFLMPLPERRQWLFSYTCEDWDVAPESAAMRIGPEHRAAATALLAPLLPDLARTMGSGRVFCDAYGPGRIPLVAPLPGMTNAVLAGGASGSGWRLAPALAARALAALGLEAHERAPSPTDLAAPPLSPSPAARPSAAASA